MARLLLVDDHEDQLELRKMLFEGEGHAVFGAGSVEEAQHGFDEFAPDGVVMDLRIPRSSDGIGLIRWLRGRSLSLKIIVLSGWRADLDSREEKTMVNHLLQKPAPTRQLLDLVR